jgi:hypothetical protein
MGNIFKGEPIDKGYSVIPFVVSLIFKSVAQWEGHRFRIQRSDW